MGTELFHITENALYDTFSTIAQALAGAIALLGALVLYSLDGLSKAGKQWMENLAQAGVDSELGAMRSNGDHVGFYKVLRADADESIEPHRVRRELEEAS